MSCCKRCPSFCVRHRTDSRWRTWGDPIPRRLIISRHTPIISKKRWERQARNLRRHAEKVGTARCAVRGRRSAAVSVASDYEAEPPPQPSPLEGRGGRRHQIATGGVPTRVATLAAQSTISCACSTERARTCRSQSIQAPINRRRVSARRFPRQSDWSLERTIHMRLSVLGTSACLRPGIYSRSLAV